MCKYRLPFVLLILKIELKWIYILTSCCFLFSEKFCRSRSTNRRGHGEPLAQNLHCGAGRDENDAIRARDYGLRRVPNYQGENHRGQPRPT